ncbi:Hsp20/alpha crystallin family protein [uncultured Thiothrix sp.]|jgi:HSP20 family protein|uniref:Hsp20/alpha crystallin family protein n=1 Tax=uncultured Thiothrix sp. TaxID=223185 RepID=UPI00260E3148|nr:Hsp20/alpha crystallin family protein [uncultured Thiothrix sp.]HMT92060.1 Hsp20/alpha crystallin family protein [Thiolinea sp.]
MYSTLFNFSDDLFNELENLQRHWVGRNILSNIRPVARGSFPAINLGSTPNSVEVYAFVPGVDAKSLDIQIDKNLLTLQGERVLELPKEDSKLTVYAQERFSGKFKRVITLPDDVDVSKVSATYKEGVLHISIQRREEAQAKRIEIQ